MKVLKKKTTTKTQEKFFCVVYCACGAIIGVNKIDEIEPLYRRATGPSHSYTHTKHDYSWGSTGGDIDLGETTDTYTPTELVVGIKCPECDENVECRGAKDLIQKREEKHLRRCSLCEEGKIRKYEQTEDGNCGRCGGKGYKLVPPLGACLRVGNLPKWSINPKHMIRQECVFCDGKGKVKKIEYVHRDCRHCSGKGIKYIFSDPHKGASRHKQIMTPQVCPYCHGERTVKVAIGIEKKQIVFCPRCEGNQYVWKGDDGIFVPYDRDKIMVEKHFSIRRDNEERCNCKHPSECPYK